MFLHLRRLDWKLRQMALESDVDELMQRCCEFVQANFEDYPQHSFVRLPRYPPLLPPSSFLHFSLFTIPSSPFSTLLHLSSTSLSIHPSFYSLLLFLFPLFFLAFLSVPLLSPDTGSRELLRRVLALGELNVEQAVIMDRLVRWGYALLGERAVLLLSLSCSFWLNITCVAG